MTHFNKLTPAEAERLACLLEELGEAQQAIGKILRHGYESVRPGCDLTNREYLEKELGDVRARVVLMLRSGDLNDERIKVHVLEKLRQGAWLHHQDEREEAGV